jgi:hypothetical protein
MPAHAREGIPPRNLPPCHVSRVATHAPEDSARERATQNLQDPDYNFLTPWLRGCAPERL